MEFYRPEYWSGQPFFFPCDLPKPGIEPRSSALQANSFSAELQGKPKNTGLGSLSLLQQIFPGIKPGSPAMQTNSLPAELPEKPGAIFSNVSRPAFQDHEDSQFLGRVHTEWMSHSAGIVLRTQDSQAWLSNLWQIIFLFDSGRMLAKSWLQYCDFSSGSVKGSSLVDHHPCYHICPSVALWIHCESLHVFIPFLQTLYFSRWIFPNEIFPWLK